MKLELKKTGDSVVLSLAELKALILPALINGGSMTVKKPCRVARKPITRKRRGWKRIE